MGFTSPSVFQGVGGGEAGSCVIVVAQKERHSVSAVTPSAVSGSFLLIWMKFRAKKILNCLVLL